MPKLQIDFNRDSFRKIMEKIMDSLEPIAHEEYTTEKVHIDDNGVTTHVRLTRRDGSLYRESKLEGGVSPTYERRIEKEYAPDGETITHTTMYRLHYNSAKHLIKEELI